jgi:serine/threonine-protein kinase RsbW
MTSLGEPGSNGTVRQVRLRIPARPEYIALCRLALTGLSRLQDFGDEVLEDLKLALTEACTNSVRHAYGEGVPGTVEILYELHPDRLVVEVSDEGGGFDPAARGPGDELGEGGLGIAIIRAIADEVQIGPQADGRGSRLRFIKSLA